MGKMYVPKGITTCISADVKMTVKIRDNYYSIAGHEERSLPASEDVNLEYEWDDLYDELYDTVAGQMRSIKASVKNKK